MEIKRFAPVLIPTLCRYKHLKRCIDSLARNTHASKTILYIALDAPAKEEHKNGYNKIVEYLNKISGFKKVFVIKRHKNFGVTRNTYESIDSLFKKYDRIIFSEDDNYFSPNFLDYINKGLQIFKNRKDIFAICGYNFPVEIPSGYHSNFFLFKGCPNWGVGWWKSKYYKVDLSLNSVEKYLGSLRNMLKIKKEASYLLPHLFDITTKNIIAADSIFSMNLVKNSMFCVLPTISKVRNYGYDGSGAHAGNDNKSFLANQNIDDTKIFNFSSPPDAVEQNEEISSRIDKALGYSNKETVMLGILYFVRNTGLYKFYKKLSTPSV